MPPGPGPETVDLALSVTEGANSDIILDGAKGTEQVRVTEHPGVDTALLGRRTVKNWLLSVIAAAHLRYG